LYAFQIIILALVIAGIPLVTKDVTATASYSISISVNPTSGEKGTSFKVIASVSISNMKTGTAYVILKTVAPDGTYAYYASSAKDVPPHRQWTSGDMPVSQTYTWTVTATQKGDYVSTIEIVIDGDAPNGFLKDSRSATFSVTSSGEVSEDSSSSWIDVSVSPSSVQQGGTVKITVSTSSWLPANPQILTYVYPPSSSKPATSYSGKGTFSFSVPSNAQTGTWTVKSVIRDSASNKVAQDQAVFSVITSGGEKSSGLSSWIQIRSVRPGSPYEGQAVKIAVRYNYAGEEIHKRVRLIAFGQEMQQSAYKGKNDASFSIIPTKAGTFTITAILEEEKRSPVFGKYWSEVASDSYTITVNVKLTTQLVLEFPKKVYVGDAINITVKLLCGGLELKGISCKLYVDQSVHNILSGGTFTIKATRTGTIDVSAKFEGDEAHKPSQNGGGLIEVWTKPKIEVDEVKTKG